MEDWGISIVQGASKEIIINPKSAEVFNSISNIYLTCSGLSICKVFNKNTELEKFTCELTSAETILYPEGNYTYDIEVVFSTNKPQIINGKPFIVIKRENPRTCEE